MGKKTTLEKIDEIAKQIGKLQKKIGAIQDKCKHTDVSVDRRVVGYNGYGNDYTTYCQCKLCNRSWFHDGYCSGDHKGL